MIELKRGDVLRVKEEFEVRSAEYTKDGTRLWSMVLTVGAGRELVVVGATKKMVHCRVVDYHDDVVSAYIILHYDRDALIGDRVEIIKRKD